MALRTLESLTFWLGMAAFVLSLLAAVASGLTWHFRNLRDAARDSASAQYKTESEARMAEAHATAISAEARAAEANQGAAQARRDAAQANERAANANLRTEQERLARLQLETRLAPRVIAPERKGAIAAALKAQGKFTVQLFALSDVTEVGRLVQGITETIRAAGWDLAVARMLGSGGVTVQGVAVAVKRAASPAARAAAATLATELNSSGVNSLLLKQTIEELPTGGAAAGAFINKENVEILVLVGNK